MGFEKEVQQLAEAGTDKDGFTAANVFKEVGLCNVSALMKAYHDSPAGPNLVLTDQGAAQNGAEYLSLGIRDSDWFKTTTIIPLAPKFEVKPCDTTKKE
jgi:hypothetical protein